MSKRILIIDGVTNKIEVMTAAGYKDPMESAIKYAETNNIPKAIIIEMEGNELPMYAQIEKWRWDPKALKVIVDESVNFPNFAQAIADMLNMAAEEKIKMLESYQYTMTALIENDSEFVVVVCEKMAENAEPGYENILGIMLDAGFGVEEPAPF